MTKSEMLLVARLLRKASDEFGRRVCNDFDLESDGGMDDPAAWKALCEEAERRNGTPHEFDPGLAANAYRNYMPDWWVMSLMAEKIEEEAKEQETGAPTAPLVHDQDPG